MPLIILTSGDFLDIILSFSLCTALVSPSQYPLLFAGPPSSPLQLFPKPFYLLSVQFTIWVISSWPMSLKPPKCLGLLPFDSVPGTPASFPALKIQNRPPLSNLLFTITIKVFSPVAARLVQSVPTSHNCHVICETFPDLPICVIATR